MKTVFEPESGSVPLTESRLHQIEEAVEALVEEGAEADRAADDATDAIAEFELHKAVDQLKERVAIELALDNEEALEGAKVTRDVVNDAFEHRVHDDEAERQREVGHALDDSECAGSMTVSHVEIIAEVDALKRADTEARAREIGHALDASDHADRVRDQND